MKLLVGWGLDGPVHRPDTDSHRATLGEAAKGPARLLEDLEMRLALPSSEASPSRRVQTWAQKIEAATTGTEFYAASFGVDRVGTAQVLLGWRDALVESGWNGQDIADGGDRIAALAKIEHALPDQPLPPGRADRLRRVELELHASSPHSLHESIALIEPATLWPARWRAIFALLERRGTTVQAFAHAPPHAPPETDLELLQSSMLRGEALPRAPRGDGSVLVLRGDTATELADLTASLLSRTRTRARTHTSPSTLVVRLGDVSPLENALARRALSRQGHTRPSPWRPAMQVLPLALELAFEPRDPYRLLELLTLPIGPFHGVLGSQLARAVSRQPGIGGQEWLRQRARAGDLIEASHARWQRENQGASEAEAAARAKTYREERLARLAEWIERTGCNPDGAPRQEILRVVERVQTWLQGQLRREDIGHLFGAAYAQAKALHEAVLGDTRSLLSQEDVRQLFDGLARTAEGLDLSAEEAGRHEHVNHPSAILGQADTIVVWSAVAGTERLPNAGPWNATERSALEAAGVFLRDPSTLLRAEAEAWRRVVLSARACVVFVAPSTLQGDATAPHPLVDEVMARLRLSATEDAVVTRHASALLSAPHTDLIDVVDLPALPLPEARSSWHLDAETLQAEPNAAGSAATAHEKLASCPLAWVLERRAKLRQGAIAKIASGPLLNGNLGHRLVEELHGDAAFELPMQQFHDRVGEVIAHLFATEGATLHLPGAAHEREQLRNQLVQSMRALRRYLDEQGFRIAGVEEQIRVGSSNGDLEGRLDLRLEDREGRPAVLDLKWGASTYRTLLQDGRAVQLAAYASALSKGGDFPPAGYFALSSGTPISADPRMVRRPLEGPTLEETWSRVERTVAAILDEHAVGTVHVTNTKKSLPLLEAMAVPEGIRDSFYEPDRERACTYCSFDAVCGKAWEAMA